MSLPRIGLLAACDDRQLFGVPEKRTQKGADAETGTSRRCGSDGSRKAPAPCARSALSRPRATPVPGSSLPSCGAAHSRVDCHPRSHGWQSPGCDDRLVAGARLEQYAKLLVDEDRYFWFEGRADDVITSAAYPHRVAPEATGWLGYLPDDNAVALFCPECGS